MRRRPKKEPSPPTWIATDRPRACAAGRVTARACETGQVTARACATGRVTAHLVTTAAAVALWACALFGCGRAATESGPVYDAHDSPTDANEPRAELGVVVDLAVEGDCEERFDLALYRDPAIELVQWDPSPAPCARRKAIVRYLPRRASRDAIVRKIRGLSKSAEVTSP